MTASARQREVTYPSEKKEIIHRPEFFFLSFCGISKILVPWVAFRIRPSLEHPQQKWDGKTFASSHFRGLCSTVCLYPVASRHQVPKKYELLSPFRLSYWGQKHIHFRWIHTCAEVFDLPFFLSRYFWLPRVLWPGYSGTVCFIYLFIYLFIYSSI